MDSFDIAASALTAQRMRMDTIASNLANVNSTRKEDGTKAPYRRKNVVFAPLLANAQNRLGFGSSNIAGGLPMRPTPDGISIGADGRVKLTAGISQSSMQGAGVQITQISEDETTPLRRVFDPGHPDADAEGWVEMPNINPITEMVDMISATRAYEANVTALQSVKGMMQSALEM
ncbi:MAG: flagellar basal body rod protein FlgC [Vampirovibrionales bacterium]|nr:flagellar basal body rod protein FlgC [Vampirovibrionales bacterium]